MNCTVMVSDLLFATLISETFRRDMYITSSTKRRRTGRSNERPRYTYPDPLLKTIFVRLLPAEVDDLKHRMNEAMHKLKRKPCKKSEKGRYFCFSLSKLLAEVILYTQKLIMYLLLQLLETA
jgi:hypothetical protein